MGCFFFSVIIHFKINRNSNNLPFFKIIFEICLRPMTDATNKPIFIIFAWKSGHNECELHIPHFKQWFVSKSVTFWHNRKPCIMVIVLRKQTSLREWNVTPLVQEDMTQWNLTSYRCIRRGFVLCRNRITVHSPFILKNDPK